MPSFMLLSEFVHLFFRPNSPHYDGRDAVPSTADQRVWQLRISKHDVFFRRLARAVVEEVRS